MLKATFFSESNDKQLYLGELFLILGKNGPSAYIYVRHSQSATTPVCFDNHTQIWDGYSLLHTEDEGRIHVQDLGKTN